MIVMERGEPTLAPGWLKGTSGGITSSGSSNLHLSSSLQSDDHAITLPTRNRTSSSSNDHDTPRSSTFGDRNFRRSSSSNGHMMHEKDSRSYGSFGRSHRDRDRERELDYRFGDRDYSDPLTVTSRTEKDTLRRSQSMISSKRGDGWHRRLGNGSNGSLVGSSSITSNIHKASAFEKEFPSLSAEEKQGVPEISRVSSPILSTSSQSLPMGTAAAIGGDVWTSALVDMPVTVGSNGTVVSSVQQTAPASSSSMVPTTTTGLNMAETLAQAPSRVRTVPQLSAENQRLEELAIKQSRQLIPVTPSMPKTSADLKLEDIYSFEKEKNKKKQKGLNSEKTKPKAMRAGDLSTVAKVGPQSSQIGNHALRSPARPDLLKTPQVGKLLVLKPTREKNGMSPTAKDSVSPTNSSRALLGVAPSAAFPPLRSPCNPKLAAERKTAALSEMMQSTSVDRRPSSQAQNRNDFFNSLRRKTSNHSATTTDASLTGLASSEKSDEQVTTFDSSVSEGKDASSLDPGLGWSSEGGSEPTGNGDICEELNGFSGGKNSTSDAVLDLDEEAVEFMRSLGWEENGGEEALTEEEISSFFQKYITMGPSSKLCGVMQPSKILLLESHFRNISGGASSGLTSSNPEA